MLHYQDLYTLLVYCFMVPVFAMPLKLVAQHTVVTGVVKDSITKEPLIGASVILKETKTGTSTDIKGQYVLHNLQNGVYILQASFIGYRSFEQEIVVKTDQQLKVDILLKEDINQLVTFKITAKSEGENLRQSTKPVTVISAKQYQHQTVNSGDLIGKEAGVRVRQDGGLGSVANFSVNGISGKQIKFFVDGIPIDLLGSGMNIQALPVNQIERIEIYKGAVPIQLGADALGGAINVVTPKKAINFLDAYYSYGSFNTHGAGAFGKVFLNEKIYIDVKSFYNYSDNNYKVDVTVPDQYGNPQDTTVRRFNDKFKNYLAGVALGCVDKSLTKHFSLHLTHTGLQDQIQHNALMSQPYGQAFYSEKVWGGMVRFEHQNILSGLNLKAYAGINHIQGLFVDTTLNVYTWDGKVFTQKVTGGEISASMNLLTLYNQNLLGSVNADYSFSENSNLAINVFSSVYRRTGKDPVAAKFYGEDYYGNPVMVNKTVGGIAWNNTFFKDRIASTTFAKSFFYQARGYTIQYKEFIPIKPKEEYQFGGGQLLKFDLCNYWKIKTSYEYASRLPDEYEVLGDLILVRPNPDLIPETSHNLNLGTQLNFEKLNIELNGFYRRISDIIFLKTTQFYAQYHNLLAAEIKGIEGELKHEPLPNLQYRFNATYQDVRNKSAKGQANVVSNKYYNARIPNTPVFFSNLEVKYQIKDFLKKENHFSFWWDVNYVDDFYLHWEVDGLKSTKFRIPEQLIQNTGLAYQASQEFTLSVGCTNIFNRKAYDNFSVQKPGRALHFKLRYHFKALRNSNSYIEN